MRPVGSARFALVLAGIALSVGFSSGGPSWPLELADPRGGTLTISPGPKALHLVFYATWCPACNDELAGLRELADRYAGRGYRLEVIAVARRHSADRLAALAGSDTVPGRLSFDADGAVERQLGADQLPTHVLIDASGNVVLRSSRLDAALREAVAGLIRGR